MDPIKTAAIALVGFGLKAGVDMMSATSNTFQDVLDQMFRDHPEHQLSIDQVDLRMCQKALKECIQNSLDNPGKIFEIKLPDFSDPMVLSTCTFIFIYVSAGTTPHRRVGKRIQKVLKQLLVTLAGGLQLQQFIGYTWSGRAVDDIILRYDQLQARAAVTGVPTMGKVGLGVVIFLGVTCAIIGTIWLAAYLFICLNISSFEKDGEGRYTSKDKSPTAKKVMNIANNKVGSGIWKMIKVVTCWSTITALLGDGEEEEQEMSRTNRRESRLNGTIKMPRDHSY